MASPLSLHSNPINNQHNPAPEGIDEREGRSSYSLSFLLCRVAAVAGTIFAFIALAATGAEEVIFVAFVFTLITSILFSEQNEDRRPPVLEQAEHVQRVLRHDPSRRVALGSRA